MPLGIMDRMVAFLGGCGGVSREVNVNACQSPRSFFLRPHPPAQGCTAVYKAVGNDYRLMLDSLWSYNYVER